MYKVSKSSWHYRWFRFVTYMAYYFKWKLYRYPDVSIKYMFEHDVYMRWGIMPKTICQYWRAVLIWPIVKALINLSAVALGIFLVFKFPWAALMGLGVVGLFVAGGAIFFGIAIAMVAAFDWVQEKQRARRGQPKRDNLIVNAIRAQNEKICTIMEYTDD